MKFMKNNLILFIGLAVISLLVASSTSAFAGKSVELKMSHFMSSKHIQHTDVMQPFAQKVEEETNGRVKITIYPGGALGRPPQQYESAERGMVDIAFGLHGYTPGKFPLTSVVELPFMVPSAKVGSLMLWDLYKKFPAIRAEHKDVKVLWLWTHDTGQILSNKPIQKIEDLKGMKLRCPSATQKNLIEQLGATPVMMPISELYESLQKGVVEGTVIPASAIYDFKLDQVANNLTIGDFYVSTFFMAMNQDSWKKLSKKDQNIIQELIGREMALKAGRAYDKAGKMGLEVCKKANIQVYKLDKDQHKKWENNVSEVHKQWINEMENKGLPGEKIYKEAVKLSRKYSQN